jgi:[3-methyl-2-oxobutanoate dehydrogenase (acetyl-transferring)] kinase
VHLDYAIYELLKNAMRAVVEYHWAASSLPAVNVHIAGSPEQITLRFSDQVSVLHCMSHALPLDKTVLANEMSSQGGGIPAHLHDCVWQYGFTTMDLSISR